MGGIRDALDSGADIEGSAAQRQLESCVGVVRRVRQGRVHRQHVQRERAAQRPCSPCRAGWRRDCERCACLRCAASAIQSATCADVITCADAALGDGARLDRLARSPRPVLPDGGGGHPQVGILASLASLTRKSGVRANFGISEYGILRCEAPGCRNCPVVPPYDATFRP